MNFDQEKIKNLLPYSRPFLFVDNIIDINSDYITGEYTFNTDEFFYTGHFKDNPVTPGVILLETMGQIGLVAFYIYLNNYLDDTYPLLSHLEADFFKSVKPETKVIVKSEKIYFRNKILKCKIEMTDINGELIARSIAMLNSTKK